MKIGRNLTNRTEPDESSRPVSRAGSETRGEAQPPSGTAMVEGLSLSPEATADAAGLSATPKKSSGTRTARIESLKLAIQQGDYQPLPEEIADALIHEMTAEARADLAGAQPDNVAPLETARAGSRGSGAGSMTLCSPPGFSAKQHRRAAPQVASNGGFAEDSKPAGATTEKDLSDGNVQDGERGNERHSEDQRLSAQQTNEERVDDQQRLEDQRTNEEQMDDERMDDEQMNRSA